MLGNSNVEFDESFLPGSPYNSRVIEVTYEAKRQTVWPLDVTGQIGYRMYRISAFILPSSGSLRIGCGAPVLLEALGLLT